MLVPGSLDRLLIDGFEALFGHDIMVFGLEVLEVVMAGVEFGPHVLGKLLDDQIHILPQRISVMRVPGQHSHFLHLFVGKRVHMK